MVCYRENLYHCVQYIKFLTLIWAFLRLHRTSVCVCVCVLFSSHPLSQRRQTAVLDIVFWSFHTDSHHFSHVFHCICLYFRQCGETVVFCVSVFTKTSLRQGQRWNYLGLQWRFVPLSPVVGSSAEIGTSVLLKYTDPWTFDKNVEIWVLQLNLQVYLNMQLFFSEFREYAWYSFFSLYSVIRLYLSAH